MHKSSGSYRSEVVQFGVYPEEYRERGLRLERGVRHAIGQVGCNEEHFTPSIFRKSGIFQQAARDVSNRQSVSFRHPVLLRSVHGSKLVGYLCLGSILEIPRSVFASPVIAKAFDAQASRDYDGLNELLECVDSIIFLAGQEDFLPLAVLVSELADKPKPPECRKRHGTKHMRIYQLKRSNDVVCCCFGVPFLTAFPKCACVTG